MLLRQILLVAAVAYGAAFPALAADAGDSPELRAAAADRYMRVADLHKMLNDVAESIAKTLPEERRELYKSTLLKHLRIAALSDAMRAAMVRTFTARELDALANFYGSPEGQSALAKFGQYMAALMPTMNEEMSRASKEALEELKQKDTSPSPGT